MAEVATEMVTRRNQRRTLMLLKPFICLKCGVHLGMTDGASLKMGIGAVLGVTAIKCGDCGAVRVWRPVKRKV
jgi:RNase P subunit RPR2